MGQKCHFDQGPFKVQGYFTIKNSCTSIRQSLNRRPIAAGISGGKLQFYNSGIFDGCDSSDKIDHAVVIVSHQSGRGWKIKNSWGVEWG